MGILRKLTRGRLTDPQAPAQLWRDPDRACHCRVCDRNQQPMSVLDDHDLKLLGDVGEHGWHLVLIPDDELTRGWVFSVGIWHTLGSPELTLFGMAGNEAGNAINMIGDAIKDGRSIGSDVILGDVLEDDRLVTFRRVDESWYAPMFGYATWFAQRPPLPIAQVVYSDEQRRWPWSDGTSVAYRASQPSLWMQAQSHPMGAWSGVLAPRPWPFADPPGMQAFTTNRVALEGHEILGIAHDSDGSWNFMDGDEVAASDLAIVHLAHVIGARNELAELADLPLGWEAWRAERGDEWARRPIVPES